MKLYYYPPMASLAPLIVGKELGLNINLEYMDMASDRGKLFAISPKGCLPVLELDDGSVLTETPVILSYLTGIGGGLNAAPATMSHYRIAEWMNYFSSEIHKLFTMLFWDVDQRTKDLVGERILARMEYVEAALVGCTYLVEDQYSIADIYLLTMIRGLHLLPVKLATYPNLAALKERIEVRPAVLEAMKAHGL